MLPPKDDTSWPAVESIASRKFVDCSIVDVPPPLLPGASLWNRIHRAVNRLFGDNWTSPLPMANFAVWTFGTAVGCGLRPTCATIAGSTVIKLVDDRSRRVCSQPA